MVPAAWREVRETKKDTLAMAKWEITPMVWGSDYDVWARRGMYYVTNKKRVIVYSVRLDDEGSQLKVKTLEEAKRYVADMQRELKRLAAMTGASTGSGTEESPRE